MVEDEAGAHLPHQKARREQGPTGPSPNTPRQADKPRPRYVFTKKFRLKREDGTCQPGHHTACDSRQVTRADHVDPHRIGSTRMITNRPQRQPPHGAEEEKPRDRDKDKRQVYQQRLFE